MLFGQFSFIVSAKAQEGDDLLTRDEAIQALNGPIFLDAYWTDRNSPSSTDATAIARKEVGPGDGTSTLAVVLANRGTSDITAITGTLTLPEGFSAYGAAGSQITTARASFYQLVGAGDTFTLYFDILVSDKAKVSAYIASLNVEFNRIREVGSFRNAELSVPFRLTGKPILEVSTANVENQTTSAITAGKVEDFSFEIANRGTTPVTNVIVTIDSPLESMTILGKSRWAIERIDEGSQIRLSTQVFAGDSLIGNPTSFDVTIEYSSNGSPSSEEFKLGTYVKGEIALQVYDLTINYVGATPTLVGNILNEGNTAALFTKIELVQSAQGNQFATMENGGADGNHNQFGASNTSNFTRQFSRPPSPQYLGDLTANSPLPFSIPLNALRNGEGQQTAGLPVTLKISYKDSLRESHELVVSNTAFPAQQSTAASLINAHDGNNQTQNILGMPLIAWMGIAIAAAAGGSAAVIIKRRKNVEKSKSPSNDPEKRENIEDVLTNPHQGEPKGGQAM